MAESSPPEPVPATPGVVGRLERVAARSARAVMAYAVAAGGAAVVIAVYLLRDGWPDGRGAQLATVVAIVLAALPPAVLFLFSHALGALGELPSRLRSLPQAGRARAEALDGLLREAGRERGRARLPLMLWRIARTVGESRELLTPHAAALPLLSASFLGWTALAAVAALLELAVAAVLLPILILS